MGSAQTPMKHTLS